ncbi:sensor domain-containing diguanylate cyclase [Butyrivibrio fibrisolvens]|uniref:sensor domain-containing diguanylate cyclase n=1 Tax=Butyrivibrio fibrisolvens TaxID=831 RepID=UPI0003B50AAD|nr:GGDEF domain-containing protein [Butyrivibrio fibrisolvens]
MKRRIFFISISIITFILVIISISYILPFKAEGQIQELKGPWSVDTAKVHIDNASIEEVSSILKSLHTRDVVTMSCEVPDIESCILPTVLLKSQYSGVEVLGDRGRLYSKWLDRFEEHKYIGVGYHFINIPSQLEGGRLKIKLFISEEGAYSVFEEPLIGSYHDIQQNYIRARLFSMACSFFLLVFGICFVFITLLFCSAVPNILSQLFSSILFLDLGIWLTCYLGIAQLIVDPTYLTTMEHVALFLMVPLCSIIFGTIGNHFRNIYYTVAVSVLDAISVLFIIFHFVGVVHMNMTLTAYYIISFIAFIIVVKIIIDDSRKHEMPKSVMSQELGLLIFGISIMVHMMFRIHYVTQIFKRSFVIDNMLTMGIMMYIYIYLLNYFLYITEMYAQRQENESLSRLAYADGLTNVPNRSMWTKRMKELSTTESDYCIISLDLNGLKDVNDRLGHAFGDSYIREFARVMEESFPMDTFMARIGGDEFVVVLENTDIKDTEGYIYNLTEKLNALNVQNGAYRRSVAAGYAYRSEHEKMVKAIGDTNIVVDPNDVYLLADERMYDVKRNMHNSKRIGERWESGNESFST